jgi:transcriptional regulator with XRE-family HTH domain
MTNHSARANVRGLLNDISPRGSHNANMAKRPRKPRLDQYEAFRQASGWWVAAWRDYRGLTQDELAAEVGITKGMVSDLESGAIRGNNDKGARFNRDWLDKFSKALGTTGGYLIDVNPFATDKGLLAWGDLYQGLQRLSDDDQEFTVGMVRDLIARRAKRALGE